MGYNKYMNKREKYNQVQPQPVNQVIAGRDAAMAPSSAGAGMAFKQDELAQLKRWLVLGSAGNTYYDTGRDLSLKNLEVVRNLLAKDATMVLDVVEDFSVRGLTPKQNTLLTVLAMGLSYEDMTIRAYDSNGEVRSVITVKHPDAKNISKIGVLNNDAVMVHAHSADGQKTYKLAYNLKTGMEIPVFEPRGVDLANELDMQNLKVIIYSNEVRRYAVEKAEKMIRKASQLFELIELVNEMRGWGRTLHAVVTNFYEKRDDRELAYQIIKYGQRNNWKHSDMLRKVKLNPSSPVKSNVFGWTVGKFNPLDKVEPNKTRNKAGFIIDPLTLIWAAERVKSATTEKEVVKLISEYDLPREAIERADTKWLNSVAVWDALLDKMPANAMVRNLAKMARVGLLKPLSDAEQHIVARLEDAEAMKRARIHPMRFLQAALMYDPNFISDWHRGYYNRPEVEYQISSAVASALQNAFETSFDAVVPTNQKMFITIDVSGSMWGTELANAKPLNCGLAAAAMAWIYARTEKFYQAFAFSSSLTPLKFTRNMSLNSAMKMAREAHWDSTNIGLPIKYALDNRVEVDAFIAITDNEINMGYHPAQLLKQYNQKMGRNARFATIAMTANGISVADPEDKNMLDIVGFSPDTPELTSKFFRGEF